MSMDEGRYMDLAHATFRRVLDLFDEVDPDEADAETAGDVVTITFADGARVVMNTQRPARQIWLAGGARAWHFSYDEARQVWMDDKGQGDELLATLRALAADAGVDLPSS